MSEYRDRVRARQRAIVTQAAILPILAPCRDGCGDPVPEGLNGARILAFGTIESNEFDRFDNPISLAGLVIDYAPEDGSPARRIALGFNELGMWVEHVGSAPAEGPRTPCPTRAHDQ